MSKLLCKPSVVVVTKRKSNGSRRVALRMPTDSNVEQGHSDYTDINKIVAKYAKGEVLPLRSPVDGQIFGDFSYAVDFHETQNRVVAAVEEFMEIPADIRVLFDNDAGAFFEFMNDDENHEEAIELGLLPPDPVPNPLVGDPVEPPGGDSIPPGGVPGGVVGDSSPA